MKNKMKRQKRKYEKRLAGRLLDQKKFVEEQLRREWDELKEAEKRDHLIQNAKAGAAAVAKTLLILAALGGVVVVAGIAPNAVGAMGKLWGKRGFFEKRPFQKAAHYLKRNKFVKVVSRGDGTYTLSITDKGTVQVAKRVFAGLKIPAPPRWDGWWRILIFDIPDRHKHEREMLREKLKSLGFHQLQESVFIIPYPCEDELNFLISVLNLSGYCRLIKTQSISDDAEKKEFFNLPV